MIQNIRITIRIKKIIIIKKKKIKIKIIEEKKGNYMFQKEKECKNQKKMKLIQRKTNKMTTIMVKIVQVMMEYK